MSVRTRRLSVLVLVTSLLLLASSCATALSKQLTTEQKVQDFQYFFAGIRDSYPYLALKARTDGYDWLGHEQEFLDLVRDTTSNEEFARAISRMLMLLNNGHTGISPGGQNRAYAQSGLQPWKDEVDKTTPEKADYWANLGGTTYRITGLKGTEPFIAVYSAGDCVVVDVSRDERVQGKVARGSVVTAVDGQPVHEYVKTRYGETWLKLDPLRGRNYERYLTLQPGISMLTLELPDGKMAEVEVPGPVGKWQTAYSWPPAYATQRDGSPATGNLYTASVEGKAGYIRIRQMLSDPVADMEAIKEFMKTAGSLPALVIDIRGNGGGSDRYCWDLVGTLSSRPVDLVMHIVWRNSEFARSLASAKGMVTMPVTAKEDVERLAVDAGPPGLPPEILTSAFDEPRTLKHTIEPSGTVNYSGKIFLLVDDNVFSSGESFAAFCKGSGWATVVGSYTGGDGIGYDPALLTLPNSGMTVRFSSMMGLNPNWTANEEAHTKPDVLVEMSASDLMAYMNAVDKGLTGPDPSWDIVLRECLARTQ